MRLFGVVFAISVLLQHAGVFAADKRLESRLRKHVEILASDEFEGREPGTRAERKTVEYIAGEWKSLKLKSAANDGSWFAPVALIERKSKSAKSTFFQNGHRLNFAADEIILLGRDEEYHNASLPVVFGGYGVLPDGTPVGGVAGKMVLLLAGSGESDVMFGKSADERRKALVSAGAEAVIIVANGNEGSWQAVRRRLLTKTIFLQTGDNVAPLQGAISAEYAVAMITSAGKDWDGLRRAAAKPGYAGQDLGINVDVEVATSIRRFSSANVIGKIPGRVKGSGAVVFMAHWDHLGICRAEGEVDRICNGAVDNASGIAVLTEVARGLMKKKYDRDVYFVATTSEETGLLGAYSFAANPPMPIDQIVVALNVDTIAVAPAGAKVAIIGRGTTKLDGIIESVAAGIGRNVERSDSANAYLRRQDGWALAQKGVPALMINSSFSDLPFLEKYLGSLYHGPDDEVAGGIDLSGTAEDTELHIALGKFFATQRLFPGNRTGS
jgi:hypothetical protein